MPKTIPVSYETKLKVHECKLVNPEASNRWIGKQFELHHKTIGRILESFDVTNAPVYSVDKPELVEVSEIKGDSWVVSLPKTRIHTLEQLVEYCEVDLMVWEVDRFTVNKWEMGSKDATGKVQVEPLFQVKAFLKKKKDIEAVKNEIEDLKTLAAEYPWPVSPARWPSSPFTGLLLEVNIPDLHQGKLAWGLETGGPNYDVKIATETFERALETLLDRTSGYYFDEVLFVIGNDLLNADDIEGRTTAGTYVSTDARYHKTFVATRTMIIKAVERLKSVGRVKVLPVYGNHDRLSSWHLGDSVEMYFRNDSNVEVDNRPRTRKYHQHGNVMLMFTHGDKGKKDDYPLTMATEEPVMFGSTIFRECHTGHTHKTKLDEQHGVRVRVLPALCPADDWHSQHGFVGNKRSAEAYIWDRAEGLISQVFHTEKD